MKKMLYVLLICVVLNMVTGCSANNVSDISADNDTTTMSSTQSTANNATTVLSTKPTNGVTTHLTTRTTVSTRQTNTKNFTSTTPPTTKMTEYDTRNNNCELIVNGRDITAEVYVNLIESVVDGKTVLDAEIPITAIVRECGGNVEWRGTEVILTYNGNERVFDTAKQNFGFLSIPGFEQGVNGLLVRKVVDSEMVVDYATAVTNLRWWLNIMILPDYDAKIIEVVDADVYWSDKTQNLTTATP